MTVSVELEKTIGTGYAKILGMDVVRQSFEVRRRIGVLFENPVFHPNLKVLPSLSWVGELRGLSPEIVKQQLFLSIINQSLINYRN